MSFETEGQGSKVSFIQAKPERKVFRGQTRYVNKIPDEILNNFELNEAIKVLPENYNFEIHKTVWRIKHTSVKRVALQMPEGLLMFSIVIANIIECFTEAEVVIMGDVTYGACCVDDFTAKALGCDFLVHYGHSCLVPVDQTEGIIVLYVFVDIKIDAVHFIETLSFNFLPGTRLGLMSTIQFVTTLHASAKELRNRGFDVSIPQSKPLSPGEILGCTAPTTTNIDVLIYLGDGRFHLEAAMIANPKIKAYKYDPYEKKFTEEQYDFERMMSLRRNAIEEASKARRFGIILGTLGRQGSPRVLANFEEKMKCRKKESITILLSEVYPAKLDLFGNKIDAWIQTSCPRLSIDWGSFFTKPLLNPYEGAITLGQTDWSSEGEEYPMDFYSASSKGPWTPNFKSVICCGKGCKK